jgi:hypothetical protein
VVKDYPTTGIISRKIESNKFSITSRDRFRFHAAGFLRDFYADLYFAVSSVFALSSADPVQPAADEML